MILVRFCIFVVRVHSLRSKKLNSSTGFSTQLDSSSTVINMRKIGSKAISREKGIVGRLKSQQRSDLIILRVALACFGNKKRNQIWLRSRTTTTCLMKSTTTTLEKKFSCGYWRLKCVVVCNYTNFFFLLLKWQPETTKQFLLFNFNRENDCKILWHSNKYFYIYIYIFRNEMNLLEIWAHEVLLECRNLIFLKAAEGIFMSSLVIIDKTAMNERENRFYSIPFSSTTIWTSISTRFDIDIFIWIGRMTIESNVNRGEEEEVT